MQASSPTVRKLVVGMKGQDAVRKKENDGFCFSFVYCSNLTVSGTRILSNLTLKPSSSAIGAQVLVTGRGVVPTFMLGSD